MNLADRDVRLAKFAYHLSSQLPDVRWNRRVLGVKSGLICRNTFEGVVCADLPVIASVLTT
jgi:hypothetical protein